MKTRTLLLGLVLVGAAIGGACTVDNRASLEIQSICVPTDDCTFSETCDAQYIGYPTLDVTASATGSMWLVVQVANQVPNNTSVDVGRLNSNDAHVDEAYVEYEGVALAPVSTGSNFLVPAGGTAVISVQVIPPGLGTTLSAAAGGEIVAHVRLRGYRDSGERFETGDFPVTIRICSGCVGATCGGGATCPPKSEGQLPITCPTA